MKDGCWNSLAEDRPRAVVLLSGGLDSSTALAVAMDEGFCTYAMTVDYGQVSSNEVESAQAVARSVGAADHLVVRVELEIIAVSALTGSGEIPRDVPAESIGESIPVTYVPARNALFLSLGLSWAESIGASDLFIGVSEVDSSGYPDCRPEFIEAFQRVSEVATRCGVGGSPVRIRAPLSGMSKARIIELGTRLGVDFTLTSSCYEPDREGRACGRCESCLLRKQGFREAGIDDPTVYQR